MKGKEITNVILVENPFHRQYIWRDTSKPSMKAKEVINVILVENNPSLHQEFWKINHLFSHVSRFYFFLSFFLFLSTYTWSRFQWRNSTKVSRNPQTASDVRTEAENWSSHRYQTCFASRWASRGSGVIQWMCGQSKHWVRTGIRIHGLRHIGKAKWNGSQVSHSLKRKLNSGPHMSATVISYT